MSVILLPIYANSNIQNTIIHLVEKQKGMFLAIRSLFSEFLEKPLNLVGTLLTEEERENLGNSFMNGKITKKKPLFTEEI